MAMSVARTRPSTALRPCAFSRCVRSPSACMNVLAAARVPPTPPAWPRAIPISGRRLADQKADGHWRQLLAECRYRRATATWQSGRHRALNCARPKHELRRSPTPAPAPEALPATAWGARVGEFLSYSQGGPGLSRGPIFSPACHFYPCTTVRQDISFFFGVGSSVRRLPTASLRVPCPPKATIAAKSSSIRRLRGGTKTRNNESQVIWPSFAPGGDE